VSTITRAIKRLRHYAWFIRVRTRSEAFDLLIDLFNLYVRIRAGLGSDGVIYVVGDSHSRSFRYRYPAVVYHFGGSTAHNLVSNRSATNSRAKLAKIVSKADWSRDSILLVFGEIDCRLHIYRSLEERAPNGDMQSIVDSTMERYFSVINEISDAGGRVMVCGMPPAADGVNEETTPVCGPLDARLEITRLFNKVLERESSSRDVGFLDIHSLTADENGGSLPRFRNDGVHLNRQLGKIGVQSIHEYWRSR
jgi:hypothetical protein